jgi:TolB-like protein/Flp pilus assembly protein TadD
MVVLAVALGYFAFDKFVLDPRRDAASIEVATEEAVEQAFAEAAMALPEQSIAVLPFRNRSANEEKAEFFSDGVHDELLTNLARIKELKVISRTSVMNYRDTTKNLRQIGEELGVTNILEGGVQRAGETVRINVQLIDASTDDHLWAEIYDRQLTAETIFAIQTEIALAIANALETTLSPREKELLTAIPTTNLEAYDNLLMARQMFERGNWQNLKEAQLHLLKAIELDPEFVQAHILLARNYHRMVGTGVATVQEVSEPWGDAVQSAISLDGNSAGAHAAHAQFLWINGMEGVNDAFEKALQLEPANADILGMYANYQRLNYKFDRALQLYQLARESDPLSIAVLYGLARIYELSRETDRALEQYAKIRQIDPTSSTGIGPVSGLYMLTGDMVQSINWLFKALAVDPDDSDLHNWLALAYIDFGDYIGARRWLSRTGQTENTNPMNFSGLAMLNIHEGNLNAGMKHTRRAFEDQLPDRWGSDSVHFRTLLIWALENDRVSTALNTARKTHPEFFVQNPILDGGNVLQAINVARLLQHENDNDQAVKLLHAVIAAYENPYALSEAWHASGKAQALTLLGEKRAALTELRQQVDEGWRVFWRWDTELNPNFESIREEPEFQAIVEFLRVDMARQYEQVQALERAGEIPSLPGK